MQGGPLRLAAPTGRLCGDPQSALLALDGHVTDASDSGVGSRIDALPYALGQLRHQGAAALARFRGGFALAFWDAGAGRLLLAADHLGRRTVFHTRIDGALVFSTRLRTLLALPGVPRDVDEGFLACFLSDVPPDADATFYAAIRRVPAASTLCVEPDGRVTVHEYWRPDLDRCIRFPHDDDYVAEGRALLDQAVRRQLRGPGPVVCQLSGGFDSTAVAATAARLTAPSTVHALTLAPPDGVPRYEHPSFMGDERPAAAAVVRMHPNIRWETVSTATLHPFDENPLRVFLPMGEPVRNPLNVGWFAPAMERARALGARAVLTGGLGNMTLSFDGLCGLASMARRGDWVRLWREAAALGRAQGLSAATVLRRYALKPLLPPRLQARWDRLRHVTPPGRYSAIHPDFARASGIPERRLAARVDALGDTTALRRFWLLLVQRTPSFAGGMDDLFAVESRHPAADIDLLEFCFAVPDEQYLRDGKTRWLARRVLADRLPPEVLDETRIGFQCPEFLHRMALQRDAIVEAVEALERSPLASRVLDMARLKRLATGPWPTDAATTNFGDYGAVLHRGLHIGQFLRWIEGGNQ